MKKLFLLFNLISAFAPINGFAKEFKGHSHSFEDSQKAFEKSGDLELEEMNLPDDQPGRDAIYRFRWECTDVNEHNHHRKIKIPNGRYDTDLTDSNGRDLVATRKGKSNWVFAKLYDGKGPFHKYRVITFKRINRGDQVSYGQCTILVDAFELQYQSSTPGGD